MNLPLVVVPTSASTDAPTSAMAIYYNDKHEHAGFEYFLKNPDLVLVDSGIIVAAPANQQTSMGRAFPRTDSLGIIQKKEICVNGKMQEGYGIYGSPAYAVDHGVLELAERKPDICLSGINYGENLGTNLTCSGTVGAILEASTH